MENVAHISAKVIRIGFALLFILVPLILTPWNYELFEYNKMMITYGLTGLILGAWAIRMISEGQIRIKKTPLDIPIALFVLSQLVSTLFSMDPHVSWFGYYSRFNGGMLSVLSYVALYYAFVSNIPNIKNQISNIKNTNQKSKSDDISPAYDENEKQMIRLLQVILVTGLVVAFYGVAEHFGIDKNLWVQDVQNRVFSTLGQPNWLAAYLIALIPLTIAFFLQSIKSSFPQSQQSRTTMSFPRRRESSEKYMDPRVKPEDDRKETILSSIFYFLLSIIFFLTLLWTRSRSGFLAFAIADAVFWGLTFITNRNRHCEDRRDKAISIIKIASLPLAMTEKWIRNDNVIKPFFLIHLAFFFIVAFNGVYIEQIDRWVTIKAWQNRISAISHQPSDSIQATPSASMPIDDAQSTISASLIPTGVTDSGDIRKYVWQGALNIWQSSPKAFFIGTGTETYAFAFYRYKPIGHNLTSEWDFLYNKAHNEYLNFLATTGIVGLGTYLFIIGTFIFWSFKFLIFNLKFELKILNFKFQIGNELPIEKNDLNPIVSIGIFSGWVSILVTNFFGFSVVIMQIFLYLFPAFIFVLSDNSQDRYMSYSFDWNRKTKKTAGVVAGTLSFLLVVTVLMAWFADKQFARGYHLSRSGYLPQAYQALTKAISLNPTEPFYHDEQGNVMATLALSSWKDQQATVSQELAEMSIKENDFALSVSPNNVNFWKTRTKIMYALSSIDPSFLREAIKALEQAVTLSPADPKMYYNLAILYGQTEEASKSIDLMKKSIELKPNYREGYYGLYLLLKDSGKTDEARQILKEYLTNVDPKDTEFNELIK